MAARLSALRAGRILPPGFFITFFKDSWYSFLLEPESTPGPVRTWNQYIAYIFKNMSYSREIWNQSDEEMLQHGK
jgi:hypothetical protein